MNKAEFPEDANCFNDSLKDAFMHDDCHYADLLRKKLKLWFSRIDSPVSAWAIQIIDEKINHSLDKDELTCISECISRIVDSLSLSASEYEEAEELERLVIRQVQTI